MTAADIAALVVPNTQSQAWSISLVPNGGTPIVITGTGDRITDAIYGALSTTRTAYAAAANGTALEITASEYTALAALTGAARYGGTEATMAQAAASGQATLNNTTATYTPTAFNGTYFASNSYLFAFSIRTASVSPALHNFQGWKIKWGDNSYTTGLTTHCTITANTPAQASTRQYFVVKGAAISPAVARFGVFHSNQTNGGNVSDLVGGLTGAAFGSTVAYSASGDVNTGLASAGRYYPVGIQGLMTSTKQW